MQRRLHHRAPAGSTIDLFAADGSLLAHGSLRNVSERGLGVAQLEPVAEHVFAKGEQVEVRFEVPEGPVRAEARIQCINAGQRELGLKMTPDDASAGTVARFLAAAALPA